MTTPPTTLHCEGLTIRVGSRTLIEGLTLSLARGDWLAVLGKNGVGKTLLLETLCGLRTPAAGAIHWLQQPMPSAAKARARLATLVTQAQDDAFANSVIDNVLLGRFPHLGAFRLPDAEDRQVAGDSLQALDLQTLAARDVRTLSGGERQRTAIAQALTQQTPLKFLDEPLSQLDPAHAEQVLQLLQRYRAAGDTLICSLHDANVAVRVASHALLLDGRGGWQFGLAPALLDAEHLSALYDVSMVALRHDGHVFFAPAG